MRRLLSALLLCVAMAAGAAADQTDPRLDGLFGRLAGPDAADARVAEAAIWQVWSITGTEEAILPFRRGIAAYGEGRLADALALFTEVTRMAPDFAEGWNKQATVLFRLGRHDESALAIARTLALEPRHFGALAGLGLVRRAQGRDAEALAAFERGLAVHPHMDAIAGLARELRGRVRGRDI